MQLPLVSVVMPVYNGEGHVGAAIASILGQSYSNLELIIINDGSTDGTEAVIQSFDDSRIRYLRNEQNLRIVKSLNKGMQAARGELIARMDADDIAVPGRLEMQVRVFQTHPQIDVCGSYVRLLGARSWLSRSIWRYPLSNGEIKAAMMFACPLAHPSVMYRASFIRSNGYDHDFARAEDYELWGRTIGAHGFMNLPVPLLLYRKHEAQTGAVHGEDQRRLAGIVRAGLLCKYLGVSVAEADFHNRVCRAEPLDYSLVNAWFARLAGLEIKQALFDREDLLAAIQEQRFLYYSTRARDGIDAFLGCLSGLSLMDALYHSRALVKLLVKALVRR